MLIPERECMREAFVCIYVYTNKVKVGCLYSNFKKGGAGRALRLTGENGDDPLVFEFSKFRPFRKLVSSFEDSKWGQISN